MPISQDPNEETATSCSNLVLSYREDNRHHVHVPTAEPEGCEEQQLVAWKC